MAKGLRIWRRERSDKVEEVLKYIYERWINGDPIKAIRDGAEREFGRDRAPKYWTKITSMAKEYASRHSLPTDRKRKGYSPADPPSRAGRPIDPSRNAEPMRSAASTTTQAGESTFYDQRHPIKDERTHELLSEIRDRLPPSASAVELYQYVTIDQMAAIVNRSARTLEKLKTRERNPLPPPEVVGRGGKAHEWLWACVRPWLESEYGRKLPERFPTARYRGDRVEQN